MDIRFTKDPNNNQKRFGLNPFVGKIKFYKKYLTILRHQRCLNIKDNNINDNEEIQLEDKKKIIKKYYKTYWNMKKYLPPNPLKILDIGCGLAIVDIFLYCHYYRNKNIKYYLLDKTQIDNNIHGGFREEGSFYNNLDYVGEICENSGLTNYELVDATKENIKNMTGLDLVISNISWGFHYPISMYLEEVSAAMNKGGVLILDVRDPQGIEQLEKYFDKVNNGVFIRK